ncbi:MAG: substrate-binding domain-containing protein [Limnobacter sp.]|nr:substrate-binding domain-containing protein [Limnobacter sp.]
MFKQLELQYKRALLALGLGLATMATGAQASQFIVVQSTTSTQNSGLYEALLPKFTAQSGIEVRVVAVGTGQAVKNARNCDGDVLLVHAQPTEEQFVADGYGVKRTNLMYNDFVIVGPASDPAQIKGSSNAIDALQAIATKKALFASRGDDSGTHKKELSLWRSADVDAQGASGTWYRETGSGMGATLNTGIGMNAYVLTDRATWIAFGNKANHQIVVEGDEKLFNQYGVIPVSPEKCPNVKAKEAQQFTDWLLSPQGQSEIASYRKNGQQLFFPNAPK